MAKANAETERLSQTSVQFIISKERAGSKDDELNRTYIDKLVQRENEIERTIFVESDDYEVQSVKNCAISYIETVVICSIDEDYAEFISEEVFHYGCML